MYCCIRVELHERTDGRVENMKSADVAFVLLYAVYCNAQNTTCTVLMYLTDSVT